MVYAYEFEMAPTTATMAVVYEKPEGSLQTGQFKAKPMILLGKRKDTSEAYPGYWCLPGGYLDVPERTVDAASRELEEECGIKISTDRFNLFYIDDDPGTDPRYTQVINVCYYVIADKNEFKNVKAGDDIQEVAWVDINRVPELAFAHNKVVDELKTTLMIY